ncbi:unannotated protein [freshwater metagenome]|uniref:Unannotated protein n=1 Tax=freshwater metagenome TaxID=449393 RepID=A0A6J7QMK4_9ZZZZ
MGARMKGLWPLAIVGAVLVFLWIEICFDWVGPNLKGDIPQLAPVVAAGFVAWGFYFAAGTGKTGFLKTLVGSIFGVVAGAILMAVGPSVTGGTVIGVSLTAGILALILLFCIAINDLVFVPAAFGAFACVVFVWQITGLDNFAATPNTMTFTGVAVNTLIALIAGCVLGIVHTTVAAAITPKGQKADEAAAVQEIVDR